MGSAITRIALGIAAIAAVVGLATVAIKGIRDSAYQAGYAKGGDDCRTAALLEGEKKRIEDQKAIDAIRAKADAEVAARVSSNVQKAIADARKADPDCKLTVPGNVVDELRKLGRK